MTLEADVVVVGTGAGGAPVAATGRLEVSPVERTSPLA